MLRTVIMEPPVNRQTDRQTDTTENITLFTLLVGGKYVWVAYQDQLFLTVSQSHQDKPFGYVMFLRFRCGWVDDAQVLPIWRLCEHCIQNGIKWDA